MPDPLDLLAVARLLAGSQAGTAPGDAQLRRAVSTAYYALFHKVLQAAASRFMGPGQESAPGYALLYRSFDHAHLKAMCVALRETTLKEKYRHHMRRDAMSQDTRDFAGAFPALQEARHLADYDPAFQFPPSDVVSLIDAAEVAMEAFDRILDQEKADLLALMMVKARS